MMKTQITLFFSILLALGVVPAASLIAQDQVTKDMIVVDSVTGKPVRFFPATGTTTQVVTLPNALPTVGTTLGVSAVSGSNVTASWLTVPSTVAKSNMKVKKSDATNSSDVTWVQFPNLSFDIAVNKVYELNAVIRFQTSVAGADVAVQLVAPAGTSIKWYYNRISGTAGTSEDNGNYTENSAQTFASATEVAPAISVYEIRGIVISGGTPGTVAVQFRRTGAAGTITGLSGGIIRFTTN